MNLIDPSASSHGRKVEALYDFDWLDRIIDKLGKAGIVVGVGVRYRFAADVAHPSASQVLWKDERDVMSAGRPPALEAPRRCS